MIEVEILNASLPQETPVVTICVLKLHGKEIARTKPSLEAIDPVYNEKFPQGLSDLNAKERDYNRPFFFESLEIEIIDYLKSTGDKYVKLYEARVPLYEIGEFKSYRLLRTHDSKGAHESDYHQQGRIFIRLSVIDKDTFSRLKTCSLSQLCDIMPSHSAIYRHLFLDFSWSPDCSCFAGGLPGPNCGELVVDKHNFVEWRVATGVNSFGDKLYTVCTGRLVISDIRIIFIPYEVATIPGNCGHISFKEKTTKSKWSTDDLLALHRYTYQLPISAVQACKAQPTGDGDTAAHLLILEGRDGSTAEFRVRMRPMQHSKHKSNRGMAVEFAALPDMIVTKFVEKLSNPTYRSGLDTNVLNPTLWCSRVVDYLHWQMREDTVWLRWTRYVKMSCRRLTLSVNGKAWLKRARISPDVETDFQRLRVQDHNWRLNDLNMSYALCASYPQYIVLPGTLDDQDVLAAATQRSAGRLPALSFIHPTTKAPLTRASQPKAGLSGGFLEHDKKLLLAIKGNCPGDKALRIADARPKLNANANSLQGKGFENVAFMGGPSVCTLAFLDIDNIHVMRNSLAKVRDGLHAIVSPAAAAASAGSGGKDHHSVADDMNSLQSSRWLNHVAAVLRGAAAVADSLCNGHPVLVHCSDGWDRTGQLTGLSQLLIDPYYRTIDGFYALVNKEFCSFGHKFAHRLGDSSHKESSPVFLQFLDCCVQIHRQYPTHFEYSEYFLTFFAQCTYSGYFSTFRGNNERERYHNMRTVASFEDMYMDDFDFSTVSCYINLLLHRGGASSLLLNRLYVSPSTADRQCQYLRPRTGVSDIDLWRDGLSGLNPWLLSASSHGPPAYAHHEHSALIDNIAVRYKGYMDIHWQSLPSSVRQKLEIINAIEGQGMHIAGEQWGNISTTTSSSNSSAAMGLRKRNAFCVAAAVKKSYCHPNSADAFNVCDHASSVDPALAVYVEGHTDSEERDRRERAARTLQIWFVAHLSASIAVARRLLEISSGGNYELYGRNSPGPSRGAGQRKTVMSTGSDIDSPVPALKRSFTVRQCSLDGPGPAAAAAALLGPPLPASEDQTEDFVAGMARQVTKEAEEDVNNNTAAVGPPLPPLIPGVVDLRRQATKDMDSVEDEPMMRQLTKQASSDHPVVFGEAASRSSSTNAAALGPSLLPPPMPTAVGLMRQSTRGESDELPPQQALQELPIQQSTGVHSQNSRANSDNDNAAFNEGDDKIRSLRSSAKRTLELEVLYLYRQLCANTSPSSGLATASKEMRKTAAWRVLYRPCFILVCSAMKNDLHLRSLLYQARARFIRATIVDDAVEKALFICMRTEHAMHTMQSYRLSSNSMDGGDRGSSPAALSGIMSPMAGGDDAEDDAAAAMAHDEQQQQSTPQKRGVLSFFGKKASKMANFVKGSSSKHNSLTSPATPVTPSAAAQTSRPNSQRPIVVSPPPPSAAHGDEDDEDDEMVEAQTPPPPASRKTLDLTSEEEIL